MSSQMTSVPSADAPSDSRSHRPRASSLSVARSPLTSSPNSPPISLSFSPFSILPQAGSSSATRPGHGRGVSLTRYRTSEPESPEIVDRKKELRRVKTMDDVDEEYDDAAWARHKSTQLYEEDSASSDEEARYDGPFQRPDARELWGMVFSTSAVVLISLAAILTTIYDWVL